jgi:hypothetical protein
MYRTYHAFITDYIYNSILGGGGRLKDCKEEKMKYQLDYKPLNHKLHY